MQSLLLCDQAIPERLWVLDMITGAVLKEMCYNKLSENE